MIKITIVLMLLASMALAVWHGSFTGGEDAPELRTLPVTRGNLRIGISATGMIEPEEVVDVGAQIIGCVRSFGEDRDRPGRVIDHGSRVRAGDVLAQLDDLLPRAELEKARARLAIATADARKARIRRDDAAKAVDRGGRLQEKYAAAQHATDVANSEIAQAEVAMAEARIEEARAGLRQAEINLSYTTVRSPIDGVILERRVNTGQTVVAGLNAPSLFLLAKDFHHMLVWAAINEADIADIRPGQTATFTVDAHRQRRFEGKVTQIRLNASLQQSVVTYGVVLAVDNADGALLPYMTAKLHFDLAGRDDVLLIPDQALRWSPRRSQVASAFLGDLPAPARTCTDPEADPELDDEDPPVDTATPTVWVAHGEAGQVRPVPIGTGLSDSLVTEVTEGALEPGTQVVIGTRKRAEFDFVSSFVTGITKRRR